MTAVTRVALALLATAQLVIGGWNQFWPESFYAHFPTVHLDPPYSEHYARDFGGATLGLAVVLIAAFLVQRAPLVITAGVAYSVFALPHFVFHATHLDHATTGEATFLIVANGVVALLGLLVVALGVLRMGRDRHVRDPAVDGPRRGGDRQPAGRGVRGPVP
ncbi:MAG TPA: hypothetical protein VL043_14795 [Protaetiibacter sp.]|nr:hypothetical protein [Protaetiibacter sp.]